ncbi:hypothetical protein ACHWQZ_G017496 [Mnemiopsis leidyi]
MASKKFLLGIAIIFCVLYVMFVHLESSYKYYNETAGPDFSNLEQKDEVKHHTKPIVYSRETGTSEADSSYSKFPIGSKVAIILNCEGRSGSTWLSSFFWNNPNVFYVYEPLYPSSLNARAREQADLSLETGHILQLADTYKCNIEHPSETQFPMVLGRYPKYQPFLKHCDDNGNCPESLTSYCHSKSHVVQKVIRVHDISDYLTLQREIGMPLKIIHLIRDPRPHIMSREKLFDYMFSEGGPKYGQLSPSEQSKQRRSLCSRELANLKVGDSGVFTADQYIRLSHEEMSVDPIKWAKRLYEFVGLDFTKETEEYIEGITHGKSLVQNGKDPDGRFAGFSVYRDTLTVLYKWMSASPKHIHEIEVECKELLDYLGYVNIYDDSLNKIAENPWPRVITDKP